MCDEGNRSLTVAAPFVIEAKKHSLTVAARFVTEARKHSLTVAARFAAVLLIRLLSRSRRFIQDLTRWATRGSMASRNYVLEFRACIGVSTSHDVVIPRRLIRIWNGPHV